MGRGKEPELPITNPVEAKKHRDEATGHIKNGNYDRGLNSLAKVTINNLKDFLEKCIRNYKSFL